MARSPPSSGPGHADLTYELKYGIRDYRGGGRSSARETAMRVAAGAVARKVLGAGVASAARWCRWARTGSTAPAGIGPRWIRTRSSAPIRSPQRNGRPSLPRCANQGSSLGAVIEVVAEGVPAGLGAPVYGKLDADIAAALMSINAVKGVEIGDGFAAAALRGEQNADEMRMQDGVVAFESNHAGGILGGISSGQPIVARFAVKPTSSILTPRRTVDRAGRKPRS